MPGMSTDREERMRAKLQWALMCALAFPSFVVAAEADAKNAARIKWAKEILADLWAAARSNDYRQVEGLISPELARGYPKTGEALASFAESMRWELNLYDSYKVTSEEIDPEGGEVILKGELLAKNKKTGFKARIARESAGKWSIRYFVINGRKDPVSEN